MGEGSEYICISCWSSFVATPSTNGKLTCPHCAYVQPAPDNYLSDGAADRAADATMEAADADQTMQDGKSPWAAEGGGRKAPGLEPISFDDLEELEQLLSSDEPVAARRATPPAEAGDPTAASADPAGPQPQSAAEPSGEPRAVIWRLKSASGLTYSFYEIPSLLRWAQGLGRNEGILVSLDGITWKPFDKFKGALGPEGEGDPVAAFDGTVASKPTQAAPASRPAPAAKSNNRDSRAQARRTASPARGSSNSRTGQAARPKLSTTAERMRPTLTTPAAERNGGESPARATQRSTAVRRASASKLQHRAAEQPAQSQWLSRLVFMGIGAVIGGAGVYFGMYLLGFYELQLPL